MEACSKALGISQPAATTWWWRPSPRARMALSAGASRRRSTRPSTAPGRVPPPTQGGAFCGSSGTAVRRPSGRRLPATTATATRASSRAARAVRPEAARSPCRSPDGAPRPAGTVAAVEAISILAPDDVEAVHDRAMTIIEEIGTDVRHEEALALLRASGQDVEGERVRWDRQFVMEMVASAPSSFTLETRNPDRAVTIGGGKPVLAPVGGSPFCSDRERGRRDGGIADHVELVKLAHAADLMTCLQSGTVEANDLSEHSRHLDMDYSILRWADKPYVCYGTSGPKARDAVELAAIACGGRARIEATPAIMGVVNPNSPRVWDFLMVDALYEWARAGQPVIVTPFLLAGATAPVSVAGGLALQVAEALTGVALVQLIPRGAPALFGS